MKNFLLFSFWLFTGLSNLSAQKALDFDGINDYASSNATLSQNDNFTLEVYTQYRTHNHYYQSIIGFGSDVEIMGMNGSISYISNNGSGILTTPFSLVNGQWYHFALVRRSGTWEFYIDGINYPVTQRPAPNTGGTFHIGGRTAGSQWNGIIDEARVWTVARTQAEIQANIAMCLTGNEAGLHVYHSMEDGTGSTIVADLTGNNNNLTLQNMDPATDWVSSQHLACTLAPCSITDITFSPQATICDSGSTTVTSTLSQNGAKYYLRRSSDNLVVDGPITGTGTAVSLNTGNISTTTTYNVLAEYGSSDQGLDFDGVNDYVTAPFSLTQNDNITLEARAQFRGGTDYFKHVTGIGNSIVIKAMGTSMGYVVNSAAYMVTTPVTLNNLQWYHFALVRRNGVWELYIDGVHHPTTQAGTPATSGPIYIGGLTTAEKWNGVIDEVRYWSVSRTAVEIQNTMNTCLNGNEAGLLAYYNMEGNTATVLDFSTNNNHGTMTNMDPASDYVTGTGTICPSCSQEMTSTVTVQVNSSNTGTDVVTACDSYLWLDGVTYTSSNNSATHLLTNAVGCDSLVTLNLTINNSTTGTDAITACDSYTWIDGNTYTASNTTATHLLTNTAGCDSLVTLNLTINNSSTGTDVITACDSYLWIDGNTYTSSNNSATHLLTNAVGCDSLVTLNLTLNNSTSGIDVITACDSYTWIDGNTYTASNSSATHLLINAVGCDSLVTLNLTINNSTTGTDVITACDSYTWIDGNTYTASNSTATHLLTNAVGCDSLVTLNLTLNNSTSGIDVITACDSYTWIDGNTYTASNSTATHLLTNAVGCDSLVTLNLTINNSTTGTDAITACDSYTWIDGNTYTASNTTATHLLTNAAGCDSLVTLNLTINNSTTGTDAITACDSYTWIDGNTYTSSNSTATHLLTNSAGCDSLVTLNLTLNNSTTGTDAITACDSYTWIDGNTYTASNSSATHLLINAVGCDSLVTLNLTINNSTTGTDVITACDSYLWIDGNTYTASNSTATHLLTNAAGCDSLVTLNLTLNNSTTGTDVITACDSYTWIDGVTYTASNNTATQMLATTAGCDSLVTLNLTLNFATFGSEMITACDSYTWIDGVTYTASNNSATHILLNASGCDSVVSLNLTINQADTSVTVSGATLTANASGAQYQWIDCSNNSLIMNATGQSYTAPLNRPYAVIVTQNNCTDTSACHTITNVGIRENNASITNWIYPNPNAGSFIIESTDPVSVTIFTAMGQVVHSKQYPAGSSKIELDQVATGMYMVRFLYSNGSTNTRTISIAK